MTVWIVEQGYDYEGDTVTSVHASEEGALAAMCKLIERHDEGQPPVEPVARRRRCGVQGVEGGAGEHKLARVPHGGRAVKRTPMRQRNSRRLAQRRAVAFGEQAARCEAGLCVACVLLGEKQIGPTYAHHDPSRGAGGTDTDSVGLCEHHHTGSRGVHKLGRATFWRIVGIEHAVVVGWMREPGMVIHEHWAVPA